MTIRTQINDDHFGGNLRIWIVDFDGDRPTRVLRPGSSAFAISWEHIAESDPGIGVEPTLTLRQDMGRALADALVRHFQGAEDTRALRRDYDAERARVDAQAQVIADVARTLAATRIGGAQ